MSKNEYFGPRERAAFANSKMKQLRDVLDPSKDKKRGQHLMSYRGFRAVQTAFYGAYTFENRWITIEPSPEEVKRIRARAAFAIWTELKGFGYKDQANKIIEEKTGRAPIPLNRPPGFTPPSASGQKK